MTTDERQALRRIADTLNRAAGRLKSGDVSEAGSLLAVVAESLFALANVEPEPEPEPNAWPPARP